MDSARWERIQTIFFEAADLPGAERQRFLETACGSDIAMMAEVQAMLQADGPSASIIDRGLPDVAYHVLGAPVVSFPFQEVGPYRLKAKLGQGGMGVVFLAEREDTATPVAIKFLLHAGMSAPRRESFAREIKTVARLKHRFIARLYDAGSLADGTPWFVMEYVEGVRLTDYCRQNEMSAVERLRLFRNVCEAVQYAYRLGIIHRDLKPSNILVEKDGTPRLLDFGIARQLQSPEDETEQPTSSLRFGSPEYAAPEWIHDGIVGAFTDVYSLGVILYEMLTARLPNQAGESILDKPSLLSPGKTGESDLDVLCLKAMDRDAQQRYQSVEELIRDIDHYLKCEPLEARPRGWVYRTNKFVRRHRAAVLAASLVAALIVGLVVFFTVRLAKARNLALAEASRTRHIQRLMLNLFGAGEKVAGPSSDLRVVTLLDRGVQEAKSLNSDPETQAELYLTLGTMYQLLGSYQTADGLLALALDKTKASLGPESPKTASALVQLGLLRGDEARFPDAERLVRQGLDIARRHLPPDDLTVLDAQSALGRILALSGANEKAIAVLTPIVQIRPSGQDGTYLLLETLTALGYAQQNAGHFDLAESINRRALALDRQLHGNSHPRVATDLTNIGTSEFTLGRLSEAEASYREAIRSATAWYGPRHPDVVVMTSVLARVLVQEHQYDEAESLLQQVLAEQERAYGPDHFYVAFTLDTLGKIALRRGNLRTAETNLTRALKIDKNLFGYTNRQTVTVSADLADVFLEGKQYPQAEKILHAALQPQPPGSPGAAVLQVKLGRSLLRQQRYHDAEPYLTAGYATLAKQPKTYAERLEDARKDCVDLYHALHQDAKAGEFRPAQ